MAEPIFHTSQTAPVKEYRILWTAQKHQKTKTWHDGYLRLHSFNKRMLIYDNNRTLVTDKYHKTGRVEEGDELDFEHHLVTVEEFLKEEVQDLTPVFSPAIQRKQQKLAAVRALNSDASPARLSTVTSPAPLTARGSTVSSTRHGRPVQNSHLQTPIRSRAQPSGNETLRTPAIDTPSWQKALSSNSARTLPPQPNFQTRTVGPQARPNTRINHPSSIQPPCSVPRPQEAIRQSNHPNSHPATPIRSSRPINRYSVQPQTTHRRAPATASKPASPIPHPPTQSSLASSSSTGHPKSVQSDVLDDISKELAYFEADLEDDDEWDTPQAQKREVQGPERNVPSRHLSPQGAIPAPAPAQRAQRTSHPPLPPSPPPPPPVTTEVRPPPTYSLPSNAPARYSSRLPTQPRPRPSAPQFQYDLPPSPSKPPSPITPPPPYSSPKKISSVSSGSSVSSVSSAHVPSIRPVPFQSAHVNNRPSSSRSPISGNHIPKSIPPRPPPPPSQAGKAHALRGPTATRDETSSPALAASTTIIATATSSPTTTAAAASIAPNRKRIHLPVTNSRRKRSKLLCMSPTNAADDEDISTDEDARRVGSAPVWRNRRKTEESQPEERVMSTPLNDDDDGDDDEENWAQSVKRNGGFVSARDAITDMNRADEGERRPTFKPPRRIGPDV